MSEENTNENSLLANEEDKEDVKDLLSLIACTRKIPLKDIRFPSTNAYFISDGLKEKIIGLMLGTSKSLGSIARDVGLKPGTLMYNLLYNPEFYTAFHAARYLRLISAESELIELADSATVEDVSVKRLQVETRFKLLEKLHDGYKMQLPNKTPDVTINQQINTTTYTNTPEQLKTEDWLARYGNRTKS